MRSLSIYPFLTVLRKVVPEGERDRSPSIEIGLCLVNINFIAYSSHQ